MRATSGSGWISTPGLPCGTVIEASRTGIMGPLGLDRSSVESLKPLGTGCGVSAVSAVSAFCMAMARACCSLRSRSDRKFSILKQRPTNEVVEPSISRPKPAKVPKFDESKQKSFKATYSEPLLREEGGLSRLHGHYSDVKLDLDLLTAGVWCSSSTRNLRKGLKNGQERPFDGIGMLEFAHKGPSSGLTSSSTTSILGLRRLSQASLFQFHPLPPRIYMIYSHRPSRLHVQNLSIYIMYVPRA